MAAPSLASSFDSASRRSSRRFPIDVALDVVALQSGIPNNMPGRCCDLSETGLGAVIAGEMLAGQAVAIELRLPDVGLPVRARAQVRYQERLRCGLQFVGLSVEQREKIRYWSSQHSGHSIPIEVPAEPLAAEPPVAAAIHETEKPTPKFHVRRRRFVLLLAVMAALAAAGWWRWQRAWNAIEEDASSMAESLAGQPVRVPLETMDQQIIYKVDPVYPDAARQAGVQGLVVLQAVIAPDGTVKHLRRVAGPEVLAQSAVDAVQSWKYAPYRVNGRPVEIETTVSVNFRLR